LQYQNPLDPVQQQDLLGQLAQFSVLDGIERLNVRFDDLIQLQALSQGVELIGKPVEFLSGITGELETGIVTEAHVVDQNLMLTVNGQDVPIAEVLSVQSAA
jgi:flagellar basal-body rod modification protein FlgD